MKLQDLILEFFEENWQLYQNTYTCETKVDVFDKDGTSTTSPEVLEV